MSEPIISVDGLGKRYLLQHEEKQRYHSLRDEIAKSAQALWRDIRHPQKRQKRRTQEDFWALRDVNLDIQPGERIGIIGRNGAGKSTLLKVLSRITEPTQGRVTIRGRVASLLEVGTGFHPELTGRENIFLNGAILGMTRLEILRKFSEIVEFAEVEKFLDTPVKHYSSGMYVRLAFAVAAHLEPEILVVDEVLAVGDATFQKKCLGKMKDVATGEGRTILFVSHSMAAISVLCPRSVLLQNGRIVLDDATSRVVSYYQIENHRQGSTRVDLTDAKRTGTGKVLFASVSVKPCTVDSDEDQALYSGEDIEISVTLLPQIDASEVNVAIIFYDSGGYRLIDINTALKGKFLEFKEAITKTVEFKLINPLLKQGTYLIGLWVGRGGIEEYDYIEFACSVTINSRYEIINHVQEFPGTYCCEFLVRDLVT